MATEHGVFRTAKVLSREYGMLKRPNRGIACGPAENGQAELAARRIELLPPGTGGAECLIELEGHGVRCASSGREAPLRIWPVSAAYYGSRRDSSRAADAHPRSH